MKQQQNMHSLAQMRMGVAGAITAMFVCFGLSFALSGQINPVEASEVSTQP